MGEIIQFDEDIFRMGWFNHQPVKRKLVAEVTGIACCWWWQQQLGVDISPIDYEG